MDIVEIKAYAKVNLALDVVRRLENGYHEVKMIMQSVGIYDTISLQKTEQGIWLTSDSKEVPLNENNLIYKAARLMQETYGIKQGVAIHLVKRIPVSAGMAGGSTDAAAVLRGMNELFHLKQPKEKLMAQGAKLGADVPYCVLGGTALACGIGEQLTALPNMPDCFILVAKPDLSVSTRYVYENLNLAGLRSHPDMEGMVTAIQEGSLHGIIDRMSNVLESVTEKEYSVITRIKQFMKENGALMALMSGSGPTVFGIYDSEGEAQLAKEKLSGYHLAKQIFVTKPV
ncbi:MAG TPA: 4-(cytidine 5'-diphospho)-2-C-methyl-D-erythritol kinase [Lachnospiraceae bacterium]|nr:4-(cytidine 5'-diphospho)-2-C-methyl-D-erythritol kinase [Lachnospiraceae bacterium]